MRTTIFILGLLFSSSVFARDFFPVLPDRSSRHDEICVAYISAVAPDGSADLYNIFLVETQDNYKRMTFSKNTEGLIEAFQKFDTISLSAICSKSFVGNGLCAALEESVGSSLVCTVLRAPQLVH
jgi:hypothetical protein